MADCRMTYASPLLANDELGGFEVKQAWHCCVPEATVPTNHTKCCISNEPIEENSSMRQSTRHLLTGNLSNKVVIPSNRKLAACDWPAIAGAALIWPGRSTTFLVHAELC